MSTYIRWPDAAGGGIPTYATFAALPASADDGAAAITLDTDTLYIYNLGTATWLPVASPDTPLSVGPLNFGAGSPDGAEITGGELIMQVASAGQPGLVTTDLQDFGGLKLLTSGALVGTGYGVNTPTYGVPNFSINQAGNDPVYFSIQQETTEAYLYLAQSAFTLGTITATPMQIGTANAYVPTYWDINGQTFIGGSPNTSAVRQDGSYVPLTVLGADSEQTVNIIEVKGPVEGINDQLLMAVGNGGEVFCRKLDAVDNSLPLYIANAVATDVQIGNGGATVEIFATAITLEAETSLNSNKITDVLDPVDPQDAATKAYVDGLDNPVTLTAIGASPNANGASLSSQILTLQPANTSFPGVLTAADWNTFNSKQAAGNYITALTSDVSASGPGSVAATVNSVGGSSAANVHSAELLANAATDANTASAIVKRDASGNFSAGIIKLANNASSPALQSSTQSTTGVMFLAGLGSDTAVGLRSGGTDILLADKATGTTPAYLQVAVRLLLSDGAQAAPALGFYNEAGLGVYRSANHQMTFVQQNTNMLQVGSTGVILPQLTASRPLQLDSSKIITAAAIDISSSNNVTNSLAIANGGTGASTKAAAFDALSPMTTVGDIIYGGASGTGTRLANGTTGQLLGANTGAAPSWKNLSAVFTAPTITTLTSTGTTTGYRFTITAGNATVGATYTNNGNTFTVLATIASGTTLFTSGASAPQTSGTLTKATGTGDATLTFSVAQALATHTITGSPLYVEIEMVGGGGSGGASGTGGGSSNAGTASVFGTALLVANGGAGGGTPGTDAGAGGTASLGTGPSGIALQGGDGVGSSFEAASGQGAYAGGAGGVSPFGGAGGKSAGAVTGNGAAAIANSGSGGQGGSSAGNLVAAYGGGGGGAGGYIEAVITSSIGATYYYAIGAGGAAGSAGTSGSAGGAGGSGVIIVKEFYQ